MLQLAKQQLIGQWLFDVLLDDARQRPGAEFFVVARVSQPARGLFGKLDRHAAIGKLRLQLKHELFHHLHDDLGRQPGESDDGV